MTMEEQESEILKQEEKSLRTHCGLIKGQETKRKKQKRKHKIQEEQECKRRKPDNEGQTMMSGDQEKDISKRAKVSQQRDNNNAEAEELERCKENEHMWTTGIQENQAIGGSNDTENRDAKQDRTYHEDTNLNITLGYVTF